MMNSNQVIKINMEIYYKEKLLGLLEGRQGTKYERDTDKVDIKNLKDDIKNLQRAMHNE